MLQSAITKVSSSFDLWGSKNKLALLGFRPHFINNEGKPTTTLLALPRPCRRHTGTAIAENVGAIIAEFALEEKVGYFITDHASNNESALNCLGGEFGLLCNHR